MTLHQLAEHVDGGVVVGLVIAFWVGRLVVKSRAKMRERDRSEEIDRDAEDEH